MANNPEKKNRLGLVLISIVIIIVLILIAIYINRHAGHTAHQGQTKSQIVPIPNKIPPNVPDKPSNGVLPNPKIISLFSINVDNGKTFNNENLKGHWTMLFFGFTRCGDVCPTTLSQLNEMMNQLGKDMPQQSLPQVVMVSVDSERDTPAAIQNYVKNYNPAFIGATADAAMLNKFSQELGMRFEKAAMGNDYMINHTADVYLIDPAGQWVATFTYPHNNGDLAKSYEDIFKAQQSA